MENSKQSPHSIPFYRDERIINIFTQVVSSLLVIGLVIWLAINFKEAADARGLALSYDFLSNPAGFPISDPAIEYSPDMSFTRAFTVGLLNTLRVAGIGIVTATILGTLVALARLSSNWLLSRLALVYIEFHRNIPLLVLLFLWYFAIFQKLPVVGEAIRLPGPVFLTRRGIYMAWPRLTESGGIFRILFLVGLVLAVFAFYFLRRRRELTGKSTYYFLVSILVFVAFTAAGWFLSGGRPFVLDVPELSGFNFQGGKRLTPEFAGLFIGLSMYTAGFIAEVVRAGIQAVDRGQIEAARAVGLSQFQVLTLVVMPQALRIIVPPMISQYLNLTKNSSLALAIGYQDLFSVGKIAINQAGRAVPVFFLVMVVYLTLSLLTSFILNFYNNRIQFKAR
ncbi:MAG TPA: ABC transporter permease subunit [Anaerolineales bacterium]|nr:ABC transporter permease subunit [Anaerolineales bacterium]